MRKLRAWWRTLRRSFEGKSRRRVQLTWRPQVDLLERRDLPSSSQVVLISLDGATPRLIDQYLATGVLDPNSGLGYLRTHGLEAQRNVTVNPSLTAPGHIAIATGSSAANNDVVSNTFRLLASPFNSNVSGFAAPIGGYDIHGPGEDADPTANPVWQTLRAAGKTVVAATFAGADGAEIKIGSATVQAAADRTVDYTVPFGAFAGVGAQGFTLTAADFGAAPAQTMTDLIAAGHPSFSPVLQKTTALETFVVGGQTYVVQVAALDTTNDGTTNYDTLVFFDTGHGGISGPFTSAPLGTGPAYVKASTQQSGLFYLEGSSSKAGTGYFVSTLAPNLSTVHLARYSANAIPRNPAVLANIDDVNAHVGFWAPQADFRIPERLSPGFTAFSDAELEAMYEDQVRTFVNYQTNVALRSMQQNPNANLSMFYIEQPDGSEHQFLLTDPRQASDPTNPNSIGAGQDPVKVARYQKYVQFAYQQADQAVKRIMDAVGYDANGNLKSNAIVVSDHGFAPFHTAVNMTNIVNQLVLPNVNSALTAAGLPTITSASLRAITTGPAVNVYLNLTGRDPAAAGQITRQQYLVAQPVIAATLAALQDSNPNYTLGAASVPVFDKVYSRPTPADINDPDFGLGTSDVIGQDSGDVSALLTVGYNFDGVQGAGLVRKGDPAPSAPILSVPNFYGAHGYDPALPEMSAIFFAAGPSVGHGVLPLVHNIDIAPTIDSLFGLTPASTVQGTAINLATPSTPLVVNPDSFTVAENAPSVRLDVLANDSAVIAGGQLGITGVSTPSHGTIQVSGDGQSLIYVPNASYMGPDSFSYTASNTTRVATVPREILTTVGGTNVYDGYGSALAPVPGTTDEFYSMTDRGPNVDATPTTTLSSAIGTGDSQITVAANASFPNTAAFGSFSIQVQSETMTATFVSATATTMTFNVARSAPVAHAAGATVALQNVKAFPMVDFNPQIGRFKLANGALTRVGSILLKDAAGNPMNGLPNKPSFGGTGEIAIDFNGNFINTSNNVNGIDSEGLVALPDGTFWVSDEYGPFLTHFDASGKMIEQVTPFGPNAQGHQLPQVFAKRRVNRGMEGLTVTPDGSKLVGIMQSPLINDISSGDTGRTTSVRIVTYEPATGVTHQYLYLLNNPATLGGSVSEITAVSNTEFLVDERDGAFPGDPAGPSKIKQINRISLAGATDVGQASISGDTLDPAKGLLVGGTTTIEKYVRNLNTPDAQALLTAHGINPVSKSLAIDLLADLGSISSFYAHDKVEGLALINGGRTLVLSNDDDFGVVNGPTPGSIATKTIPTLPGHPADFTQFLFIDLSNLPSQSATTTVTLNVTPLLPNGVAAGDTTQTTAVLWTHSFNLGVTTFEVFADAGLTSLTATLTATVTDPMQPVKVQFSGLEPATDYYYRVTDAAGATGTGHFRTATDVGSYNGLHFGVSGDQRGELAPFPSITNAAGKDLDFFLEFGDTIYADVPSPDLPKAQATTLADYRIKQNEVYSARDGLNANGDLRASTSVLAVIDDHEVTNDFAGGALAATDPRFNDTTPGRLINDTALFDNGVQAFQEYNPIRDESYGATGDPRTAGERKQYRYSTYGQDAAVFVLDARSFRDQELPPVTNPADPAQVAAFLIASFSPTRTMLGHQQFEDLKHDLLAAENNGVTWKFVMTPEPIQNFGVVAAQDRWEGYASERSALLRFIDQNHIHNVVFVTADFHGTTVNRLSYQDVPGGPQHQTDSFEIITGPVAYDKPFGPTIVDVVTSLGLITPAQNAFYNSLPEGLLKEQFLTGIINPGLAAFGYNLLSPTANPLPNMSLLQGLYMATAVYGWSEFRIDPDTQALTITTWGIDPYNQAQLEADPASIIGRIPRIVGEFAVTPVLTPAAHLVGSNLVVNGGIGNDVIEVTKTGNGTKMTLDVTINGQRVGEFGAAQVGRMYLNGLAGNDTISVVSPVKIDSLLIGGSGDDELHSGGGSRILLGGAGNDRLFGGNGRNILIGGLGNDDLHGQGDSDILIGGRTAYDHRAAALWQILAEWASSDPYSVRVAKIQGGIGVPALNDASVFDDFVRDDLFGGGGLDWLFVSPGDRAHNS